MYSHLFSDITTSKDSWQRRVVMATWMLVALVLVRSYASNLMSVLAVRYVQQPYQSLRNVLEDPGVTMIWQTNSSRVQYFRVCIFFTYCSFSFYENQILFVDIPKYFVKRKREYIRKKNTNFFIHICTT